LKKYNIQTHWLADTGNVLRARYNFLLRAREWTWKTSKTIYKKQQQVTEGKNTK